MKSATLRLALNGWKRRLRRLARTGGRLLLMALVLMAGLAVWRASLAAPEPTLLIRDRHGEFLGETGEGELGGFGYWPLEELPPRVVAATLAVEDHRFWTHPGVDPIAVARAFWQNIRQGERISGASTIAMQVARLQHPGARTYVRKFVEALTAVVLTLRYGREAVLAHYLRIVPYGNQIHGIAYAARRYLDKPVEDLSWAEIAFLAAIPQAPARMNPFRPAGRRAAEERGKRILAALEEAGVLSDSEYALAMEQIVRLRTPFKGRRPLYALHAVLRLGRFFDDPRARRDRASSPIIRASLDLDLQQEVAWMTESAVRAWRSQGVGNAAVIVVARESNEVLAWVGSTGYFDDESAGAIDYTNVPRSSGSTLKPFLYALALERGIISPASILADLPRGAAGITNSDQLYLGPLLARAALANSRNVPAVGLLERISIDEGYALLEQIGLHDGSLPARHYGLGLAIGGLPVTLEKLVKAYTVFTLDGRQNDLIWYRGQPVPEPRRVVSEDTARQIALFLSDPMARLPTFPRMGWNEYPFPVAVKTGTSSNYRDAWAVAFSTRYLVGVWVGHPDYRPMSRLSGYRAAARLVHQVMGHLHRDQQDGLEDLVFPPPRASRAVRLCALTGKRATDACDRVSIEWFHEGQEPVQFCDAHMRVAVDTRTGFTASSRTPPQFMEVRTFVQLQPVYAAWSARAGLPHPPRAVSILDGSMGAPLGREELELDRPVNIEITSPEEGLRLLRDPETPEGFATLALQAVVDPPTEQVLWYVDGKPFRLVDYPYVSRWPLQPGEHTIQARLPHRETASRIVRVVVQ